MSITPIGCLIMPAGIILFMFRPQWLYFGVIFLVPFSATAVVNLGTDSGVFSLQATMFLGVLWIANRILATLHTGRVLVARQYRLAATVLVIFCGIALMSLIMPILIDGSLSVPDGKSVLDLHAQRPLVLSTGNVTQWMYLLYGVILTLLVASKNSRLEVFHATLRTCIYSGIFVSLWGILQALFSKVGIPYPHAIFNTASHEAAMGYAQMFSDSITRVSSVTLEPSFLGQYLTSLLPLLLVALAARRPICSHRVDLFAAAVVTICLLLSTASTAYLGLAVASAITVVLLQRAGWLRFDHAAWCVGLMLVIGVACAAIPTARLMVQDLLLVKPESYSALERFAAAVLGWQYFLKYPILGIGWGTLPPSSLITYLLGHTGILGAGTFLLAILLVVRRLGLLVRIRSKDTDTRDTYAVAALASLLSLLFVCVISGMAFYLSHFWLFLGMAMAALAAVAAPVKADVVEAREEPA